LLVTTKFFSFWGLHPPDPLPGLCPWTPLGDFHPPDPLWFYPIPNLLPLPMSISMLNDKISILILMMP